MSQVPRHQIGIAANDRDRVAQLLARNAKVSAPMIQTVNLTDIYPRGKMARVYGCCLGQFHILFPSLN